MIRPLIIGLSLLLLAYSALSVVLGLGQPGVDSPKWCSLGLCPEEFSDAKVLRLIRQARGPGAQSAIGDLKRAVVFNPASAYAWADLGDGLVNAREFDQAKYCFQRAVAAGPRSPIILLRAANFEFEVGTAAKVMADLLPVLRDPELTGYYSPVFLTYSRLPVPISTLLENGVPASNPAAQAFLRSLMEDKKVEDAEATWNWLLHRNLSDDRMTADYIAFLIQQRKEVLAAETWAQLNSKSDPDFRRSNWVYNGNFANPPKPSVLDWRLEGNDDVSIEQLRAGGLHLVFGGMQNVDFHGVSEQVVLGPGRWTARASIRTAGITTNEGIRLRVAGQNLDLRSDSLNGTHDWTTVELPFAIGLRDSTVVRIEVERAASLRFDNKVAGQFWVTLVQITPADASGKNQKQYH